LLVFALQVWALKSKSGDMRIAVINKDGQQSCTVNVNLDKQYCKQATLSRLLSPGGVLGKADITWQGQTYENAGYTGKLQGQQQLQQLLPQAQSNSSCVFAVSVSASSAALLVSKASVSRIQAESAALRIGKPQAAASPTSQTLAGPANRPTPIAKQEAAAALQRGSNTARPAAAMRVGTTAAAGRARTVAATTVPVTAVGAGMRISKPQQKPASGSATTKTTHTNKAIAAPERASSVLRVGAHKAAPVSAAGPAMRASKPKKAPVTAARTAASTGKTNKQHG
jgi:hypothetical protein